MSVLGSVVALSILLVSYLVLYPTPVDPTDTWEVTLAPMEGAFAKNEFLSKATRWAEGKINGPETVTFDSTGRAFGFTYDGFVQEILNDGSVVDYVYMGGRPLSGAFGANDELYVVDPTRGLFLIDRETKTITLLAARTADGKRIGFADDVVVASDGKVYLSDAARFTPWLNIATGRYETLRASILSFLDGPSGRILMYDPATRQTTVLADNLLFPNGVTLSPDESSLVFCETFAARVMTLSLVGDTRGEVAMLTQLPSSGDGVSTGSDGYWVAIPTPPDENAMKLSQNLWLRRIVAKLPPSMQPKPKSYGMVVQLGFDGTPLRSLHDTSGLNMELITAVTEHKGKLYLGGIHNHYVGVYDLSS